VITITVASYNGALLAQPLAAHFDEMGGNIGRADNNQLVLPDPELTISRVHAQVVFRGGRYAIVDRGSNPISVNGRPLGNGQEALLQPGDEERLTRIAVLVRLAEGLERSRDQVVREAHIRVNGATARLELVADGEVAVPRWAAAREVDVFRRAFGRELEVA